MKPHLKEISGMLTNWSDGNGAARDESIPLVFSELHRLARRHMARERSGHSLQPTALVLDEGMVVSREKAPKAWLFRSIERAKDLPHGE